MISKIHTRKKARVSYVTCCKKNLLFFLMFSQNSNSLFSFAKVWFVPAPPLPPLYPSSRRAKSIPSPRAIFGGITIFEAFFPSSGKKSAPMCGYTRLSCLIISNELFTLSFSPFSSVVPRIEQHDKGGQHDEGRVERRRRGGGGGGQRRPQPTHRSPEKGETRRILSFLHNYLVSYLYGCADVLHESVLAKQDRKVLRPETTTRTNFVQ